LSKFFAGKSAQSFMNAGLTAMAAGGSSCGAGDGKKDEQHDKK
jgi:hypothetical protein